VRKRETFVDGDNVSNSVTRVKNDTSGTTGSVEGKDGLDGNVEGGGVEGLENDLSHLLSVGFGVDWGLSEKNWVLLGCNTELVVESVMPDLLHIIPVGDDTVLNWISQGENTTLGLRLITDIRVLLTHTNHNTATLISFKFLFECHKERGGMAGLGSLTHGGEDVPQWKLQMLSAIGIFEVTPFQSSVAEKIATLEYLT
jgi:hypothetical protein